MKAGWLLEAALVGEIVAIDGDHLVDLLIPYITGTLEKQQRHDVGLSVGAVERAAVQDVGGLPEVGFKVVWR